MSGIPFIYSNQPKWRILRHTIFWLLWFIFQMLLYSFSPSPFLQSKTFLVRLSLTAPESLIYLLPHMFMAYTLMYIVVTKFVIKRKYLQALAIAFVIFLLTAGLSAILSLTIIEYLRQTNSQQYLTKEEIQIRAPLYAQFGAAMMAGLRGSITIGGLASTIKIMKCFYEKEQAALLLEKEKVITELQMLKAQLHPHFLFNTLNNIYSYTQDVSLVASNMIFGLSELLRYMLYECNQPYVPLHKELKMINDYISLEKVRYDAHLDLSVNMPTSTDQVRIAPLLLLPLVENCFKHGASKMIRDPWISIQVTLSDNVLLMKLVNGKAPGVKASHPGIGTTNTQKRLELIYADRYEFQSFDEEDMYIVNLKLWLDDIQPIETDLNSIYITNENRENIQLSDR
jgi:sensor histidine kinase YesM